MYRAVPLAASSQLSIVYRSPNDLIPDSRNARTHPKRQIEQLCASLRQFGFTNPVLIDEQSVLIAGHGRLRAAREIGLAEVPTIELAGLTEAQKKALRLADNKIALNAGWDVEILRLELDEIGTLDVDFDLSLTGFASGEIDVVLKAANDPDEEVIPVDGECGGVPVGGNETEGGLKALPCCGFRQIRCVEDGNCIESRISGEETFSIGRLRNGDRRRTGLRLRGGIGRKISQRHTALD